jgi:hypothetical protein
MVTVTQTKIMCHRTDIFGFVFKTFATINYSLRFIFMKQREYILATINYIHPKHKDF